MKTKYITNDGPNTIYVGGKMIAPGEGRDVDEHLLPPDLREPAQKAAPAPEPGLDDLLGELRAKSVKDITAALPKLTQEALDRLSELEQGDPIPRKTLLTALGDEVLRRANDAMVSDPL